MKRHEQKLKEAQSRLIRSSNAYKRLFNTPDGKKVLEDLTREFGGAILVKNDPYVTHARVGEFGVLQYINAMLEVEEDVG